MSGGHKVIVANKAILNSCASRTIVIPAVVLRNRAPYFGVDGFNAAGSPITFTLTFRQSAVQIYRGFFTGTTRLTPPFQGLIIPMPADDLIVSNSSGSNSETWVAFFVLS